MNVKTKRTKKQVNVENQAINLLPKEELNKKIEVVEKELRSCTWRELETNGKFSKNDKLSFITDDMLISLCDGCISLSIAEGSFCHTRINLSLLMTDFF